MNKIIKSCIVKLKLDPPLSWRIQPKDLRGAIAKLFPEERLLHQHLEDGKINYHYPFIQYKIINRECLLVGLKEGAELISGLNLIGKSFSLKRGSYKVFGKEFEFYMNSLETIGNLLNYQFATIWLALNEKNYLKYQMLGTWAKRKIMLEKILVGNILSMSKGLGYTVPAPLEAIIIEMKEVPTKLKGTPMLGFLGTFSVNFEIPDYWGIGKSVSRGFGTVKRIE